MKGSRDSFRVQVTIPLAVFASRSGAPLPTAAAPPVTGSRLRSAVARMPLGGDPAIREVLELATVAVCELERKVAHLEQQLALARAGIELEPTEVLIGQDGLALPGAPAGREVAVVALLELRGMEHLLVTRGLAHPATGGHEVEFVDTDPALRDVLVAFCFQRQGEERRRALSAAGR